MAKKPTTKKPAAEKKPSLDIKDEMLYSDYKVFDWLDDQTPEMAKTFSALVAMKWQSVIQSPNHYDVGLKHPTAEDASEYILNVNEFVNQYFWDLSKYPDLQWRLMCAVGRGEPMKHGWIPLASRRKAVGKIDQVFLDLYPQLNDEELALLQSKYDVDGFRQLLKDMAMPDGEIKKLVDEFKKRNG